MWTKEQESKLPKMYSTNKKINEFSASDCLKIENIRAIAFRNGAIMKV